MTPQYYLSHFAQEEINQSFKKIEEDFTYALRIN